MLMLMLLMMTMTMMLMLMMMSLAVAVAMAMALNGHHYSILWNHCHSIIKLEELYKSISLEVLIVS